MEERILLYKNKEAYKERAGGISDFVDNHLQKLMDELKKNDVPSENLMEVVMSQGTFLDRMMKDKAKEETASVPALYSVLDEKYLNAIAEARRIAQDAYRVLSQRFYVEDIEKNIYVSEEGHVSINNAFINDIEEMCSEYADSDERKKVYTMAVEILEKIKELQDFIDKNKKPSKRIGYEHLYSAPEAKLLAITRDTAHDNGILEIDSGGDVEINLENIALIK